MVRRNLRSCRKGVVASCNLGRHARAGGHPVLREAGVEHQRSGVLDHPLSRMMTTNYVAARRLLPQRLQNLHQLGVNEFIAADQGAGFERILVALDAADGAPGFAPDDLSGPHIPWPQASPPIAVEAAPRAESQ